MITWIMLGGVVLLTILNAKQAENLKEVNRTLTVWQGIAVASASEAERANHRTLIMHALVKDMATGRAEDTATASIMGITAAAKISLPHTHVLNLLSDALDRESADNTHTRMDDFEKLVKAGTGSIEVLLKQKSSFDSLQMMADAFMSDSDPMEKDAWVYAQIGAKTESA